MEGDNFQQCFDQLFIDFFQVRRMQRKADALFEKSRV